MFRATPSFQLAMSLLVLFIAYVLQVRTQPYLSHAKAAATVLDHERKVMEGVALHVKIEGEMRGRAAYYKRSTIKVKKSNWGDGSAVAGLGDSQAFYASRRSPFENALLQARSTILHSPIASVLFDYNTAEALLLGSAILINLAGICFDSSEFSGANPVGTQAAYDSLAYCVLVVIGASIIYWVAALGMDLMLVIKPKLVASCLSKASKASRKALAQSRLKLGANSSKPGGRKGGDLLNGASGLAPSAGHGVSSNPAALTTTNNPLVMTAMQTGRTQSLLNTASIAGMAAVPDQLTWDAVREAFVAAMDRTKASTREIEKLREEVEELRAAAGAASGTTSATPRGGRATFGPVAAASSGKSSLVLGAGSTSSHGGPGKTASLAAMRGYASSGHGAHKGAHAASASSGSANVTVKGSNAEAAENPA